MCITVIMMIKVLRLFGLMYPEARLHTIPVFMNKESVACFCLLKKWFSILAFGRRG